MSGSGPMRYLSSIWRTPWSTDSLMNFHENEPGGAFFLNAQSAMRKSASCSLGTTAPPLVWEVLVESCWGRRRAYRDLFDDVGPVRDGVREPELEALEDVAAGGARDAIVGDAV